VKLTWVYSHNFVARLTMEQQDNPATTHDTGFAVGCCVCVDTVESETGDFYPMMRNMSADTRRLEYWRMAWILMQTTRMCYPNKRLLVFTNDTDPAVLDGHDFIAGMRELNVDIVHIPFKKYRLPKGFSQKFTNAFYKYEAFQVLGTYTHPTLMLDTDVVWAHNVPAFEEAIAKNPVMSYDVYQRSATPTSRRNYGISMEDFGKIFKEVDPEYPIELPVHMGGEALVAHPASFAEIDRYLYKCFTTVIAKKQAGDYEGPEMVTRQTFFNGNESLLSMTVNRMPGQVLMNAFVKRIYNLGFINNVDPNDPAKPVWHLPGEKPTGIPNLYRFIRENDPRFWKSTEEDRAKFMGAILGVPKRTIRRDTDPPVWKEKLRILRGYAGVTRNNLKTLLGIYKA
jgi:hypothetical protein